MSQRECELKARNKERDGIEVDLLHPRQQWLPPATIYIYIYIYI